MKFTVLGGQGVIGRALVAGLCGAGHEVEAPGRGQGWDDVGDWGHVIYAIGLTADFRTRSFDTVDAHVGVLSSVLSNLSRRGRFESFLYLSSTRIYSGADSTSETAPLRVAPADPSDLYNLSKLMGEALCFAMPNPTVRVARLSNVVGGADHDSDNFVPALLRQARAGCIRLNTALSSEKDYIHIDDVVRVLSLIAVGGVERIYNVASGVSISHAQWAAHLVALTACSVEVAVEAPEVRWPAIDVRRIRAEFGYVPRSALSAIGP